MLSTTHVPTLKEDGYKGISVNIRRDVMEQWKAWAPLHGFVNAKRDPSYHACCQAIREGRLKRIKAPLPAWVKRTGHGFYNMSISRVDHAFSIRAVRKLYECFSHLLLDVVTNFKPNETGPN